MPKIYFYKLTVDDGGAPCVTRKLLSLCICKPQIRATASVGDIIIGFAANSLHADNRLIYVARVNKKLTDGNYFRHAEYRRRQDSIYRWQGDRLVVRAGAVHHGSQSDLVHNMGHHPDYERANTLLSWEFCYFGAAGTDEYKELFPRVARRVATLERGHRVYHDAVLLDELKRLVRLFCTLGGPNIKGKPTSTRQGGSSRCRGGCGVVLKKSKC